MASAPILTGLVGQSIRGYTFEALIAQGGFGQVYRAFQPIVERQVAIKVILPQYANVPNFVRRFDLEAQLVAQLEHPYIVPLYDYWRDPSGAYLVMRMLRGGSLASLLESYEGPLPIPLAARILEQVAAALTTAHRNGVIHRDLKPANVLLDDEQNAYLADFGIAKRLFTDEPYEFDRFGSPAYVAPEIVTGDFISAQTDIYSLGIILFEMLTNTLPYSAPSQTLVLQKHLTSDVPSVTGLRPDLPKDVDAVIRRATQRQPKDRYADALAMAQEFKAHLAQDPSGVDEDMRVTKPVPEVRVETRDTPRRHKTPILNIAAVAQKNPYKGLRAFQEADQNDFFGRDNVIQRLIQRLRGTGLQSRCIALIGASGSGKSSLVRAGLIPALRRAAVPNSNKWFFAIMTPGKTPLVELEQSIAKIAVSSADSLAQRLAAEPESIHDFIERLLPAQGEFLLVVDQFEEAFSQALDSHERDAFLYTLSHFISHPRARLILTLRADFVDAPLSHAHFGSLLRDCTEFVLPLTVSEMEAAITKPSERLGVGFEPGLIPRIIQDIGMQPGTLPLLQYVLYELFENRTGDVLTLPQYENEGGVFGALARRAEHLYTGLDQQGQAAVQRLFLRLVVVGNEADETRRRMTQQEAMELGSSRDTMQEVLDSYGRHRLLTFDRDSVTRAPTVEIAHEALIRNWGRLRGWIDQNRTVLRLRQQLAAAAEEWEAMKRDPSFLARGGRLNTFEIIPNAENILLTQVERDYLDASLALRRREASSTRQTILTLAAIATIALLAAAFALVQRNDADRERDRADTTARLARADQLAIQATSNRSELDFSLLLSVESLNSADTYEARRALLDSLQYSPRLIKFLHGQQSAVRAIATSQDGLRAAAAAADGAILVWSLQEPETAPTVMRGHEGLVNAIDFSPDGQQLVSGGEDTTVRIWDIDTATQVGEALSGHEDTVWDVAYSPDGAMIVSASEDTTLRRWDVGARQPIGEPLRGHTDPVYALAFSPDGRLFASGSEDGTVRVWEAGTGEWASDPLIGHDNWVLDVEFSPDGQQIASSDADGIIQFWSVDEGFALSGEPIRATPGSYVWDIAFRADGQQLAAASADDTVTLWTRTEAGWTAQDAPLVGHTNDVRGVAYANSDTLVSGGRDARVAVWLTGERPVLGQQWQGAHPLRGLSFNGDLLATGTLDDATGTVAEVWRLGEAAPLQSLRGSSNQTTAIGYVPKDGTLLTANAERELMAWPTGTEQGELVAELTFTAYAIAVSPDGLYAAVGGDNSSISVFSLGAKDAAPIELEAGTNAVYSLTFSPQGDMLIAGDGEGRIQRWMTETWMQVESPVQVATVGLSALAYNRDGSQLAVGTRDVLASTVQVFNADDLSPLTGLLSGHENWIVGLTYLNDTTLASASHDGTVRLWTLPSGESLVLRGHSAEVTGIAISDAGQLVSVGDDGRIIAWDLDTAHWIERACAISNRNLTEDEWLRYFRDVPYHTTCERSS